MGGPGSGGARLGAGRRQKDATRRWLGGSADRRGPRDTKAPELPGVASVVMPGRLTPEARKVWRRDSRAAIEARTLTPASAEDFGDYCELVVDLASVMAARRERGWTKDGLRLFRAANALVLRIESKRRAFLMAPMGKPLVEPKPEVDPFSEFDRASADNGTAH